MKGIYAIITLLLIASAYAEIINGAQKNQDKTHGFADRLQSIATITYVPE
jgi:hypothetical protein